LVTTGHLDWLRSNLPHTCTSAEVGLLETWLEQRCSPVCFQLSTTGVLFLGVILSLLGLLGSAGLVSSLMVLETCHVPIYLIQFERIVIGNN
jgi:hypothetical protein